LATRLETTTPMDVQYRWVWYKSGQLLVSYTPVLTKASAA